jgi:hypothetical protein
MVGSEKPGESSSFIANYLPCRWQERENIRYPTRRDVAGILSSIHNLLNPENILLQHELYSPKLPSQVTSSSTAILIADTIKLPY